MFDILDTARDNLLLGLVTRAYLNAIFFFTLAYVAMFTYETEIKVFKLLSVVAFVLGVVNLYLGTLRLMELV